MIRNILKENSTYTNDSWEKPLLSLTIRNITAFGNGSLRQDRDWVRGCVWDCCIWCTPHLTDMCGTGPFFGGSGRRAVAHTNPGISKNTYGPGCIPLIRGATGTGRWTQTPEGSKSLGGGRPPEAERNLQIPRHTRPDPCRSKHGRPKCDPTTGEAQCYYSRRSCCVWDCSICCTPHQTGKCGTRPFFRWVRAPGRCPYAPGIPKNAYGPVGILLIRGTSGTGRWIHPVSRRG